MISMLHICENRYLRNESGQNYIFDSFYNLLIREKEKSIYEEKPTDKLQECFTKGKVDMITSKEVNMEIYKKAMEETMI